MAAGRAAAARRPRRRSAPTRRSSPPAPATRRRAASRRLPGAEGSCGRAPRAGRAILRRASARPRSPRPRPGAVAAASSSTTAACRRSTRYAGSSASTSSVGATSAPTTSASNGSQRSSSRCGVRTKARQLLARRRCVGIAASMPAMCRIRRRNGRYAAPDSCGSARSDVPAVDRSGVGEPRATGGSCPTPASPTIRSTPPGVDRGEHRRQLLLATDHRRLRSADARVVAASVASATRPDEVGLHRQPLALDGERFEGDGLEPAGARRDKPLAGDDLTRFCLAHQARREVRGVAHARCRCSGRGCPMSPTKTTPRLHPIRNGSGDCVGDAAQHAEQALAVALGCGRRAGDQRPAHRVRLRPAFRASTRRDRRPPCRRCRRSSPACRARPPPLPAPSRSSVPSAG